MESLKGLSRTEKLKRMNSLIREIAEDADRASDSEEVKGFLKYMGIFHNYSFTNALLIHDQKPDATRVAGFRKWQTVGRYVNKGARGIAIYVPYRFRTVENQEAVDAGEEEPRVGERVRFAVGYVFDVSDTSGDPLPSVNHRPAGNSTNGMYADLLLFAESEGVKVTFENCSGTMRGYSTPGKVAVDPTYNTAAQACTLAHELAHEYLHQRHPKTDKALMEIEAETAAAVVALNYGIEPPSENYISCMSNAQNAGIKVIERMERIRTAAAWIIEGIESLRADLIPALLGCCGYVPCN